MLSCYSRRGRIARLRALSQSNVSFVFAIDVLVRDHHRDRRIVVIGRTRSCSRSTCSLAILIAIERLLLFCHDRTTKSLDASPRDEPQIVLDDQVKMLVCDHRHDRTSSSCPSWSRLDSATACHVALWRAPWSWSHDRRNRSAWALSCI